jgi:hypothetical protein
MPDKDDKLPARITAGNGDDRAPVALPFRLRETLALPIGWPPDVAPNQVIASSHINSIRTSVAQWPADVDGMGHWLRNAKLENVTGVMVDPTTTAGDLITRDATAAPVRFPIGVQNQVLMVDIAQPTKLRWATPAPVVASVFGRTGVVVAQAGDYTAAQVTNAVSLAGSYADPAWITSLAYTKLTNVPASFVPTAHTHDAAAVVTGRFNTARLGSGLADETVYLRGDGVWSVVVGAGGGGGGNVTTVFGRIGNVVAQTGDYTAAQVSGAVVDPTIALGDLMVRSGTTVSRLPAGANGQVLQSDNTQPMGLKWITIGGGVAIPGGLNDGDTLMWKAGAWSILAVGAVGQVLTVNAAGGLKWAVGAGGSQTPWLQDIDGGNHALTNVSAFVCNGSIRSIAGGYVFPDGTTMVTAPTGTSANTPNKLVLRDATGSFFAGRGQFTYVEAAGAGATTFDVSALFTNTNASAKVAAGILRVVASNQDPANYIFDALNSVGEVFTVKASGETWFGGMPVLTAGYVGCTNEHLAFYKKTGAYSFYWRRSPNGLPGSETDLMNLSDAGNLTVGSAVSAATLNATQVNINNAATMYALNVLGTVAQPTIPVRFSNSDAGSDNVQVRLRGNASNAELWAIGNQISTGGIGRLFQVFDVVASLPRMTIDSAGSVGIGTSTSLYRTFCVEGPSYAYTAAGSGAALVSFGRGTGQLSEVLCFGVDDSASPHSWIQGMKAGTAPRSLFLNALGGGLTFGMGNSAALPNSCWQMTANEAGNQVTIWYRYSTGVLKAVTFNLT